MLKISYNSREAGCSLSSVKRFSLQQETMFNMIIYENSPRYNRKCLLLEKNTPNP